MAQGQWCPGALNELTNEIHRLKPKVNIVDKRIRSFKELRSQVESKVVFSLLISEFNRLIPPEMALFNLEIVEGNILAIQGITKDSRQINQLQKAMTDTGIFTNVTLNFVNKRALDQGESNYFKITCQVKGTNTL